MALHNEGEKRNDGDEDRSCRPQPREHDRVDTRLDHPLHLDGARFERTSDPAFLPREEFNEFNLGWQDQIGNRMRRTSRAYRANDLIKHTHALVACGENALLNADCATRDEAVERPAKYNDDETRIG